MLNHIKPFQLARLPLSVWFLLLANTIPLYGVLWWEWDLFSIIVLYWLENLVIGVWNVAKLLVVGLMNSKTRLAGFFSALFYMIFFTIHYGGFMLGHGIFILVLFGMERERSGMLEAPITLIEDMTWPLMGLMVSHGISFFYNFIGKKEYLKINLQNQMGQPYLRIFVVHITIIFGAFAIQMLNEPLFALILMIVLKIGVDIVSHLKERDRAAKAAASAPPPPADGQTPSLH